MPALCQRFFAVASKEMMKLLSLLVVVGMVGMVVVAGEAPAWRITLQKGNEHVSVRSEPQTIRREATGPHASPLSFRVVSISSISAIGACWLGSPKWA